MITGFGYGRKIIEIKERLEKQLGLPFLKNDDWTFEFEYEGELKSFEIEMDYNFQELWVYLTSGFFDESEKKEKLALEITKTFHQYFDENKLNIYLYIDSYYYFTKDDLFSNGIYEGSPFVIGDKLEKIEKLYQILPTKEIKYEKALFLKHDFKTKYEIMVLPDFRNDSLLLVAKSRTGWGEKVDWSAVSENLICEITCEKDYEEFTQKMNANNEIIKELEKEIDKIANEMSLHVDEKNRIIFPITSQNISIYQGFDFDINIHSFKTYYPFKTVEKTLLLLKEEMERINEFEIEFNKFFNKLMEELDTSFMKKHDQFARKVFIGGQWETVEFKQYISYDEKDEKINACYQYGNEKYETLKGMFDDVKKKLVQMDHTRNIEKLFTDESLHLNRLSYELGGDNSGGYLFDPNLVSKLEIKKALSSYFKNNPFTLGKNKPKEKIQIKDLLFESKGSHVSIQKQVEIIKAP
jgi:hypothetical protein